MRSFVSFCVAGALVAGMLTGSPAWAQASIRIDSQRGVDTRIPVAVPTFATTPEAAQYGSALASVLAADLAFSGVCKIVESNQYPRDFTGFTEDPTQIDFEAWRGTAAEHLVYAVIKVEAGAVVAECRLFDVLSSDQVVGKRLQAEAKWSRLLAHQFADEVIRYLTGEAGAASSEICFSGGEQGKKEIYVADYDGGTVTQVTSHGSISIKPKFSPDGRKIAYLSYKDRYPFLYIYDRTTGISTPLSKRVGLNHAAAWHPNGNMLALCLSKDGNTEIYMKNADGSGERRLTNDKSSDTSPVFSPDGNQIAFVTDRGGSPQIHVMNLDGGGVRRLSFQGGNAYDPTWSPNGKYIAYAVQKPGQNFEIYVMNADGSDARPLSGAGGSNESPSWSPDSRHVVFSSSRSGLWQLYTATLDTNEIHQIPGLGRMRCEGPSWGPRRN